eukprot:scaffold12814_cov19-Tisochrysis_lutea.AAC.1
MASRLCYIAEWLDSASGVVWKYQLFYYPESKEVEVGFFLQPLTDILSATCRRRSNASSHACQWKGERLNFTCLNLEFCFLPCCADGGHQEQEAFLEKVDHKQLTEHVQQELGTDPARPCCTSTSHRAPHLACLFFCSNLRVCKLSKTEAQTFYEVHRGKPFYDTLTDFMSSGRICAMELTGPSAIDSWRQLLGPTDSDVARQQVHIDGHSFLGLLQHSSCSAQA